MPRRARLAIAGIPWHIIQRGNNRSACFYADEDYRRYLDTLGEMAQKCDTHAEKISTVMALRNAIEILGRFIMLIRLKVFIAACAMVLLSASVLAQAGRQARASASAAAPAGVAASSPAAGSAAVPVLDQSNLQTFFAGLVPYALKKGDIAGAAIAVVKDGKLIFAQGYGYADKKTRAPVVADKTLFRVGSVSKLFTWTAVMQLVQAGKIDLRITGDRPRFSAGDTI